MTRKSDKFQRRAFRNLAKASNAKNADKESKTRGEGVRAAINIGRGLWFIIMLPFRRKRKYRAATRTMTIQESHQYRQRRNAGIE